MMELKFVLCARKNRVQFPSLKAHRMEDHSRVKLTKWIQFFSVLSCLFVCHQMLDVPLVEARFQAEPKDGQRKEFAGVNSCHWREFDLCSIGTASLFQNPNGLPQSDQELNRQCEYLNESLQCFEDFATKCLTETQMGLFQMFTSSPLQMMTDFCQANSTLRTNYTKHVQCLRDIQRTHQRPCLTDFQVGFESIHKTNISVRLQTACCNVNRLRDCIFGPVEYECGIGAAEMIKTILESLVGGFFELTCRHYDPMGEECSKLLPPSGTRPHGK